MTKKLCTAVGCKAIVDHSDDGSSPRCKDHPKQERQSKERKERYTSHYDVDGKNIYSSYRWKKLRKLKVSLNPLCEHCEQYGIARPVKDVDHIISIIDGGEVWEIENLQSLCKPCHITKTRAEEKARSVKRDEYGYLIDTKKLKR